VAAGEKDRRQTRQRTAIRKAFERAARPLSPHQVLEAAQSDVEDLGLATVYRNVKALLDDGWLASVEVPGAGTLYERSGKAHHHHFHCDRCSRVFELSGCIAAIDRLAGPRFAVRTHEIVLYGLCADCRSASRARL
jgi:Fur family transcriptional regulator, ferric uptake regulator